MERYPIKVHKIVMEASTPEDRKYMNAMDKNDVHRINGTLLQGLYKSVLDRKSVDFGDIPKSNGDITKVKYYASTAEALDVLAELYSKNNIDEPAINVINDAIGNLNMFKKQFENGFKLKQDMVMLTYNSIVMAIIDATSNLIAAYTTYIVSSDITYVNAGETDKFRGNVAIESLKKFNAACDNGSLAKALSFSNVEQKNAFLGVETAVTGIVIMSLLSIVPITRELIYFFYRSRVKLSDYLSAQSKFLEMNKTAVELSKATPQKRDKIIKKQGKAIAELRKISDKIMINDVDTETVVKKETKEENSLWSLNNVEKKINDSKLEDTSFTIM